VTLVRALLLWTGKPASESSVHHTHEPAKTGKTAGSNTFTHGQGDSSDAQNIWLLFPLFAFVASNLTIQLPVSQATKSHWLLKHLRIQPS
jgi:hypothetical protein